MSSIEQIHPLVVHFPIDFESERRWSLGRNNVSHFNLLA